MFPRTLALVISNKTVCRGKASSLQSCLNTNPRTNGLVDATTKRLSNTSGPEKIPPSPRTNSSRGALYLAGAACCSIGVVGFLQVRRLLAMESSSTTTDKGGQSDSPLLTKPLAKGLKNIRRRELNPGEMRFRNFASLEFDGEAMMTPRDFLDSIIQDRPRPRIKSKVLSRDELIRMLQSTPVINQFVKVHKSEDPVFLRLVADKGVISYPEYLFLLSVLTRSENGFRVAFDLIDTGRENYIIKKEFSQFVLMASGSRDLAAVSRTVVVPSSSSSSSEEALSTLSTHFFGLRGHHKLTMDEFSSFIRGMQREVLRAEFLEYSRGLDRISATDFAMLLLKYTDLSEEDQSRYFSRLERRLLLSAAATSSSSPTAADGNPQQPPLTSEPADHADHAMSGLTFGELEQFSFLLNNLADFAFAFRLYPHAGHSLSKKEFGRAAKISMGGQELSDKIIDVVFALFDEADDNCLSYEEFFVVVRNRLNRSVRRNLRRTGFEAFKQCVREQSSLNASEVAY